MDAAAHRRLPPGQKGGTAMEYTVNGLARLAGVSVRTLHWYD